jgi:hypothetical protein
MRTRLGVVMGCFWGLTSCPEPVLPTYLPYLACAAFGQLLGFLPCGATIRTSILEGEVFFRVKEQDRVTLRHPWALRREPKLFIHQVRTMLEAHSGLCSAVVTVMR